MIHSERNSSLGRVVVAAMRASKAKDGNYVQPTKHHQRGAVVRCWLDGEGLVYRYERPENWFWNDRTDLMSFYVMLSGCAPDLEVECLPPTVMLDCRWPQKATIPSIRAITMILIRRNSLFCVVLELRSSPGCGF